MKLFDHRTGRFYKRFINKLTALADMFIETEYGDGTTLAHWDEEQHDQEIMIGFKDSAEHVLPVTIDVISLFEHNVVEKLDKQRKPTALLDDLRSVAFTWVEDAVKLNREAFVKSNIWEKIYTDKGSSFK